MPLQAEDEAVGEEPVCIPGVAERDLLNPATIRAAIRLVHLSTKLLLRKTILRYISVERDVSGWNLTFQWAGAVA